MKVGCAGRVCVLGMCKCWARVLLDYSLTWVTQGGRNWASIAKPTHKVGGRGGGGSGVLVG